MNLAVLCVTHNSHEELGPFLDSLRRFEGEVNVRVADNASVDQKKSQNLAKTYAADFLPLSQNLGYGSAINALEKALPDEFEYLVVSNPDLVFLEPILTGLWRKLEEDPRAGAAGPRILDSSGQVYPSARRVPDLVTGIGHALLGRIKPDNRFSRHYRQDREVTPRVCDWLSGAFVVYRRSAFRRLGGFDEDFFMYFEDVDLGWRLAKLGFSSLYEPGFSIQHAGGASTARALPAMIRAHHRSCARFLTKRYSRPLQAPLRWALRAGLGIRAELLARSRKR